MVCIRIFRYSFILIILLIYLPMIASAQNQNDSTEEYMVRTKDGNEFRGHMVSEDNDKIILRTKNMGEITINKSDIKEIESIKEGQIRGDEVWLENPQATRYFFSPNGYGLKRGEGYYQNVWVLWNQVAVGVTDNFSLGGGMIPLFLFAGTSTPVWLTPKLSIPVSRDKFNLGAGGLIGTVLGEDNGSFGILYGIATLGSRDKNVSFGMGYGYAGGDWATSPLFNINGMFRISRQTYLLTENYVVGIEGDLNGVISLGGRSMIGSVGLDYGLFIPFSPDMDSFIALPWLGFTVPFGKK